MAVLLSIQPNYVKARNAMDFKKYNFPIGTKVEYRHENRFITGVVVREPYTDKLGATVMDVKYTNGNLKGMVFDEIAEIWDAA